MYRAKPIDHSSTATIGLVAWGNLIEDFLDTIRVSIDDFCNGFTGSYMFGYVDALRTAGVHTVIICISDHVSTPTWRKHVPTGATICILPASRVYRLLMRAMRNPYGRTVETAFRDDLSGRVLLWPVLKALHQLVGYLATPPILLARALRSARCRAVLCQEYEFPRFDVCVLVGRLLSLPVFATFQGGDYQRWGIERIIRPVSMRACRGLIIGAAREIDRVRAQYRVPATKLAHIFNPIDLDVWRPVERGPARDRLGLSRQARIVAWHGRVSMWKKGLDVLVDAWSRLCAEHTDPELCLVLVGDGTDGAWLDRQITTRGLPGVHWHRAFLQDRAILRTYLSAADVYVFPSRKEGFAVAPIEAMACGLPVVATDISGIEDVLADGEASGGVIVPPSDHAALAAGLWRLLDDDKLRSVLANRARERALAAFSSATVGRQLRDFLLADNAVRAASGQPFEGQLQ